MLQQLILIVLALAAIAYFLLYLKPKRQLENYRQIIQKLGYKVKTYPISILGSPIFENFKGSELKYNDAMYLYRTQIPQYDVLLYNTLTTPTIQLLNPDLIKGFYQPDNVYVHHKMPFMIQNIQRSLGHGIAFSESKEWKRKRTIMNAVFNFDFIIENIPKIVRICQENLKIHEDECLQKLKFDKQQGKTVYKVNINELSASIFSNVMLECFFGTCSTHEKINNQSIAAFINALNSDITVQTFDLPVLLFGVGFLQLGLRKKDKDINRRINLLRQLAKTMINKRLGQLQKSRPREKYQDIIEALVLTKNLDKQDIKDVKTKTTKTEADAYDFKELIEEFCTFFTAGTDTTSHFTEMIIIYVAKNPKIEEKLRKQVNEHIKSDADITKDNLKKLTYIDWIQTETTRHYGPGNGIFVRTAQKDHYVCDIPIQKNTGITIQPMGSHFSPKYYKNPEQFRPERWQSQCNSNHPFALGGFSGGPRTCIGKHLAYLESKIAIVKYIKRYSSIKLPKQDFKMQAKFLYQPEEMDLLLTAQKTK